MPAVEFPVLGGCLCGAIRYGIHAAPMSVGVCHCRSCRRAAGAESVAWLTVATADFRLERGTLATYASSPGVARGFCRDCGSTLTWQMGSADIDVTLASLDDPEVFPPTSELWLEERLSWNPANPALRAYHRGMAAPEASNSARRALDRRRPSQYLRAC